MTTAKLTRLQLPAVRRGCSQRAQVAGGARPHDTIMKKFTIRTIVTLVAQQSAMIIFMRVVYLDLFVASGLAMVVGYVAYIASGLMAADKK